MSAQTARKSAGPAAVAEFNWEDPLDLESWLSEDERMIRDSARAFCQDKLAKFKIPTQIEFRKELPKTTVGKVLRRELVREHKEKVGAK